MKYIKHSEANLISVPCIEPEQSMIKVNYSPVWSILVVSLLVLFTGKNVNEP